MDDFDTSGVIAGNTNPLTLNSYVYDGEAYCPDEQEILSKDIYFLGGSCTMVYVKFVTKGTHATGIVRWGINGCTNTVNTTVIGDTHYASFDVGNVRAFYWQVESSFCENMDSTNCKKEYRPKYGVFGCPGPTW